MTPCISGRAAGPLVRRHARRGNSRLLRAAIATLAATALAAGCGAADGATVSIPDDSVSSAPTRPGAASTGPIGASGLSTVATARVAGVAVRDEPDGPVRRTLAHPTASGAPLTFLVVDAAPGWLRVQLPLRPNGSTGWVSEDEVSLSTTPYRLVVHRSRHQLEVVLRGARQATYPVGVGTSVTPTPGGTYFITELLRPPDPDGPYGPYAFGLSAFSDTLTSFAGGPGQLGLHGTDAPQDVGSDVSHGCLRVTNAVITALARALPLGTPVDIEA
jgi:lipoprotein-anchoring transpeptidase ErfK/SrfK